MLDRLLERLPPEPRRTRILLCAVALVAALFRFPGLGYPVEEYFDEVYHAKTALQYLRGEPPTEWVHPPTAKLLIAVGVALFGYWPWAWRLVPALAGTLLAPVFFLLARRVLATERAALFATLLLLLDGVYLVQSRIAMTNIFAVLFQLLAALLVVRAATAERLALGAMAGRASPWGSRSRPAGRASSPGASSASYSWWRGYDETAPAGTRRRGSFARRLSRSPPSSSFPPRSTC